MKHQIRHRCTDAVLFEGDAPHECGPVHAGGCGMKTILDPCCGSRMMWRDRADPRVVFGDIRSETITVIDRSKGNKSGTRTLRIEPDTLMDFRNMPYPDGRFRLVAFDPPHLINAGPKSWLAAKYGKLSNNWQDDLRKGFAECWRVLEDGGILVFKWNETQVPIREVLALAPAEPLFGHLSGRKGLTHWLVFMKEWINETDCNRSSESYDAD